MPEKGGEEGLTLADSEIKGPSASRKLSGKKIKTGVLLVQIKYVLLVVIFKLNELFSSWKIAAR